MTTAPWSGTAPPARPVPEPRATNGTPWRRAAWTQACTSSVDVGKQMTELEPSMFEPSRRYRLSSVGPVCTRSLPSAARRSATRRAGATTGVITSIKVAPYGLRMAAKGKGDVAPEDLHEWISFEDPEEDRTWVFDVTFLLSAWTCIYGHGCQGVLTGPAEHLEQGCCSYGAHFIDEEDRDTTEAYAARLTKDQWQMKAKAKKRGGATKTNKDGELVSRLVDGACIFLNRPGFPGGAGCALHQAALENDERPLDWKPDVCWQLPLRLTEETDTNGHIVSTLREWKRRDWGDG